MRSLSVEAVKNFKSQLHFKEFEYDGVKIYIHKGLKINKDAYVYQKRKLPFFLPTLGAKGVL